MKAGRALLTTVLALLSTCAYATEFHDSIVRELPLRSLGELRITNVRGDILIEGWAQDRIRINATRKAEADSQEEAKRLFGYTDLHLGNVGGDIELSAEYGRGLKIEDRLKERNHPRASMDMAVLAPAHLPLKVWALDGKVSVKGWDSSVDIRTTNGPVTVESMKNGNVAILCPACSVTVRSIHSSLRCMGDSGPIDISGVQGGQIYVESGSGKVSLDGIEGDQLYVSKSGSISGRNLSGRIEFHTRQGNVKITDSSGFVSGRTGTGSVDARMKSWTFLDKALIESVAGDISLYLPSRFSGDVDLRSGTGRVYSAFSLLQSPGKSSPNGPTLRDIPAGRPMSRLMGLVGEGGEQLNLASGSGNVSLLISTP